MFYTFYFMPKVTQEITKKANAYPKLYV